MSVNLGLAGGTRAKVYTGNIALELKANKNLSVALALKGEDKYTKSAGSFASVTASGTPAVNVASTPQAEYSRLKENSVTPDLDIRYSGIPDVGFYASASQLMVQGDQRYATA